jgi:ubiquitin-protein ligase
MAMKRLMNEYQQYLKDPNPYYNIVPNEKDIFVWDVLLFGSSGTIFEGAIFKCQFKFNNEYPNKPPEFKFISNFPHPNIYTDGKVCISILHEGKDQFNYEHISERWNPSHSVNSILMSILTIISTPNFESPANVDASIMWRNNWTEYKKIIYNFITS